MTPASTVNPIQPASAPTSAPTGGASLSDILTTAKNLVIAINGLNQTYLNVNGSVNSGLITSSTVIKASSGRLVNVSVISAGTSVGVIYDSTTTTGTTKPIFVIPNTVGVYAANIPTSFGIYVNPGSTQQVTVSYS